MHGWSEGLEREGAGIAFCPQSANLTFVVEPVSRADENAIRVAHIRNREIAVGNAGNMNETRHIG